MGRKCYTHNPRARARTHAVASVWPLCGMPRPDVRWVVLCAALTVPTCSALALPLALPARTPPAMLDPVSTTVYGVVIASRFVPGHGGPGVGSCVHQQSGLRATTRCSGARALHVIARRTLKLRPIPHALRERATYTLVRGTRNTPILIAEQRRALSDEEMDVYMDIIYELVGCLLDADQTLAATASVVVVVALIAAFLTPQCGDDVAAD